MDNSQLLSELQSLHARHKTLSDAEERRKWLAKAAALVEQVNQPSAEEIRRRAQALSMPLSTYTRGPAWNQALQIVEDVVAKLESGGYKLGAETPEGLAMQEGPPEHQLDRDDEFIKALGRLVLRFPTKAVGATITVIVVVFTGGWTLAKLLTPPYGERERAAVEAAYRSHNLEIPRETDLVFLMENLSKQLKDRSNQLTQQVSAERIGSRGETASPSPSQALEEGHLATSSSLAPAEESAIRFSARTPFPEQFDQVVPGMRLSEARAALPNGSLDTSGYFVKIDIGPFETVAYRHSSLGGDPIIESVIFFFRDDSSRQAAVRASLEKFGEMQHESEVLGSRLLWPDINGFQLVLEDNVYRIARSSTRQAPNKGGRADG